MKNIATRGDSIKTMNMVIKNRPVADLIPYARNARQHSDAQVAQIAASIREFGFLNPVIVDGDNGIIAGHGRVMAARKLGMESVPTVEAAHLTEAQKRAYILADNKLALNAEWDTELLRIELGDIDASGFELDKIGFNVDELSWLISGTPDFEPGTEEDQGKLDELAPKMVCCPECGHEFDSREQS